MAGRNSVVELVAGLASMSRDELDRRWKKAFGCAPPRGVQRGLLELGVAWHLQVREFGGLSPGTKRQLHRLTEQRRRYRSRPDRPNAGMPSVEASDKGPVDSGSVGIPHVAAPAVVLAPGTRLVREWHGRTHHVEVIEEGFVFEGKIHASLSAIARQITGARWSGPRFFGL